MPPSTSQTLDLSTQFQEICNRLVKSGTYLADLKFREHVKWEKFDCYLRVVEIEREDDTNSVSDNDADDPTIEHPSNSSSATTNSNGSSDSDDIENDGPVIAGLTAVVKVSDKNFYFSSDGGYTGKGQFMKDFLLLALSLMGGMPTVEPFKTDYMTVINNVKWLQSEATCKEGAEKCGFLVGPPFAQHLKVKHKLFEPVPEEKTEQENPRGFYWTHIHNWPVITEATRNAIPQIYNTHSINQPLVLDENGDPIHPRCYIPILFLLTNGCKDAQRARECYNGNPNVCAAPPGYPQGMVCISQQMILTQGSIPEYGETSPLH
ncbi:hypothetical protein BDQ17DRAFT_1430583 [Cyathus striatus]|nr:hypothetical protein BDQ17DRAFT_1430583 [Cyathus striatus]